MTAATQSDVPLAELTAEEEAEFTAMNAVAFDLLRVESQEKGTNPPTWLCLSAETRQEYRARVLTFLAGKLDLPLNRVESAVNAFVRPEMIEVWKHAERHYKYLRDVEKNPRAFFT